MAERGAGCLDSLDHCSYILMMHCVKVALQPEFLH